MIKEKKYDEKKKERKKKIMIIIKLPGSLAMFSAF